MGSNPLLSSRQSEQNAVSPKAEQTNDRQVVAVADGTETADVAFDRDIYGGSVIATPRIAAPV